MRTLIVADIHANQAALEAVLMHAGTGRGIDAVWVLGDSVGYGPDPVEVLACLRDLRAMSVAGNHDLAACGAMGVEEFNGDAAEAALWTRARLGEADRDFLGAMPLVHEEDAFTLVHGSLRAPEWEYLLSAEQAREQFARQETPYSLVGHSHLAFWFEEREETIRMHMAEPGSILELGDRRLIVNPGSAGQPRDGDPRVSYVLYDDTSATMTFQRVEYDIVRTQERMRAAGLPTWLRERLSVGR